MDTLLRCEFTTTDSVNFTCTRCGKKIYTGIPQSPERVHAVCGANTVEALQEREEKFTLERQAKQSQQAVAEYTEEQVKLASDRSAVCSTCNNLHKLDNLKFCVRNEPCCVGIAIAQHSLDLHAIEGKACDKWTT